MTTQDQDHLRQFYLVLNQDHNTQRELLLDSLKKNDTDIAKSTVALHARHVSRRWWLGSSGVAAAAVLAAGVFFWRPQDALAEIQKALRSQEWIHLVVTRLDGSQVESWESPSGQISAHKWPDEIRFVDKSMSIEQVYDVTQKKLTRLELDERRLPDSMRMLIDVLLGDADRSSWLKVTQRQQRTVTENGETWDEVTLSTEPIGGQVMTWICKIHPGTHLPMSYRTQVPTGRNLELGWVEGRFYYPSKGPLTIAELGVPEDSVLDDRIPKDSLKHIVASMKEARRKLGAYHLKVFSGNGTQLSRECWRDGSRWRQDLEVPAVCDGKQLWMKTSSGWKLQEFQHDAGWPYIEDMTYPELSASLDFELKVRAEQTDGQEGCILVEKLASDNADPILRNSRRFLPRREQFWLDTKRDYALVKHVRTDIPASEDECRSNGTSKHTEVHYSDFQQSPNGVWYPTRIRDIGTIVMPKTNIDVKLPDAVDWTVEVEFAGSYPTELFEIDSAKKRSP